MTRAALCLAMLLSGCATPRKDVPHVTGIRESRQAVTDAQASSAATSWEIAQLKTLAQRGDAKSEIVLRWLRLQDRRDYEAP